MAILVRLPKITREQYEKISAELVPTAPPALLIHVSFGEGDEVEGFQVWESQEAWAADMPRVVPVLQANGVSVDLNAAPTTIPVLQTTGSKVSS